MSERLFDVDEEYPEVPILRPPARRRSEGDARFRGEYPPEWKTCPTCKGRGKAWTPDLTVGPRTDDDELPVVRGEGTCPDCLGMGSLKARVRLEAGHRCLRCQHPYVPKADAARLGVEPSWREDGWSPCDERCTHGGPVRITDASGVPEEGGTGQYVAGQVVARGLAVEAAWRVLTTHHLNGDKADCRWGNLAALCQVCHLSVQSRVVMERVYPHPHSEWFKPHAAWWYAVCYLGEDLTREEVMARMDELLALELDPAYQ